MNVTAAAAMVVLLFILRFAVPLGIVGGLCYFLNHLCDRWDAEAEQADKTTAVPK